MNSDFDFNTMSFYSKNILHEYQNAWDFSLSMNNEKLRSCEHKLILLDKKELEGFLKQFVDDMLEWVLIKRCVLVIHLMHVFSIPGQEKKIKLVQANINELLLTNTALVRYQIFKRYLSQQLEVKYNLTDKDLLTGQIDPQHEFELKFYYWDIFCAEKNPEGCKEFLQQNVDYFVSNIDGEVRSNQVKLFENKKAKMESCSLLMGLLKSNIFEAKTPVTIPNTETSAFSLEAFVSCTCTNYSYTAYKVINLLQKILSTLSEDEIFTVFNNFLEQMFAITSRSQITENDLCTGKIKPYHELLLKLCYCEKLCNKNNVKAYNEFLGRNTEFLVLQIEDIALGNLTKTKLVSCKTLLCILNRHICNQKTKPTSLIFQNCKKATCSSSSEADKSTENSPTVYKIRSVLQTLLSTFSEVDIFKVFNNYLNQMEGMKLEITEAYFGTGIIDSQYEFWLKLCYSQQLLCQKDYKTYKEFLRRNTEFFVSQAKKLINGNLRKSKIISCKILLCLLKWNICNNETKVTPHKIPNCETNATCSTSLEADIFTKYSHTNYRVKSVFQALLSTFSEDKIYTIFHNYLHLMKSMKSEITDDDFCSGKLDPHYEFWLKLCHCQSMCSKSEINTFEEFLRKNAIFLVSQIKEVSHKNKSKTKFISCSILLCFIKWEMYHQNTRTFPVNNETQANSHVTVANKLSKYSLSLNKLRSNIQQLLSTFSDKELSAIMNTNNFLFKLLKPSIQLDFSKHSISETSEARLLNVVCNDFVGNYVEFFLLLVGEINHRNYFENKFGMCKIQNTIRNGKILKMKTIIQSITKNQDTSTDSLEDEEEAQRMIACILLFKNKLEQFNEETFLRKYQDHIKQLLLTLLAEVLVQLSTEQIMEAFFLYGGISGIQNTRIHKELAKTFLDISMNNKISFDIKLIIGRKIQPTLISHENSFKIPAFNPYADSIEEKLDNKRIINICINVVKTVASKPFSLFDHFCLFGPFDVIKPNADISIPNYEGIFCSEKKAIENEIEMVKRSQQTETLVLLMLLLITITSTRHHKSAQLKKYLSLKYEYATASLYLLWCSGDIEIHPGPSLNKKTLTHDSSIDRRWIQNISPKILILMPLHEQSKYKPTKKVRNDRENREHFKTLLKKCLEEKVHVPKMYLAEINAWETMEYKLLHKLFVYRYEIETIITSLKDFFFCGGSTNDLTDINVSFDTELKKNEIANVLGKDQRPIDQSQLMVYITRHIAGISIKCAHGKDSDAKCDKLWDLPLKNWPKNIILFDPNNRGKYSKKNPGQKLISDQELVDILLTLPQVTFPQNYKDIVDAFRTMRKSQKDKSINKQHKAELCSTFKRITSLEKLDYALKNLWESGIFTEEVHNNLNKWWTTGAVDTTDDQKLSQVNIIEVQRRRRPHILMNISTTSITLTVEQTDASSSQVSYDFPFKDECVPLKTMATTVHQTTIQKPSSDSYKMVTAKKYSAVSSKPHACPADNQTDSIIIPPYEMAVLNSYFPCDLYPNIQVVLESDIKHQHKKSSQETDLCSTIHFDQPTSSTNKFSQFNQHIIIPGKPGPILCTSYQSTANSDDISSATKDSQNPDFHIQVSLTRDMGSSVSISSVNSESENEDGDQINISNNSNNCVLKTNMKKRKCIEEDRNETKKRIKPSLKQDKKQSETTSQRKLDSSTYNSTTSNKNMDLLVDYLGIDLNSFDIDEQTFNVELNTLDNEDKNLQICGKEQNLMSGETQMSNKNTNISAYDSNVSRDLEMFLQEMISGESEKMLQMKSNLSDV